LKKYSWIFCLSLSFLLGAEETIKYESVVDRCGLAIETPALSKREVKKLRLKNGLEVLLISDPETHQSGAALAAGVGSWDDPLERPGMAHFVEHLLFLGTEKYPEEEGYTRYLDEYGGTRNAFTMADRTVYIFAVNNDGFLGALDRFGHFFICPLFNPSGVDRECKAIHQEYCKNLPLDAWRMLYVKKELANKKHPFHSFCIGNIDTLAKISQDELKEWYKEHYSANLMHLVVYSSLNISALEKEVVALFSQVKNQNKKPSLCNERLLNPDLGPKLCTISPVQEVQILELAWEIPRFFGQDREIHADKLLSHVLGHEGATSLLAQLKRENLAEALSVGNFRAGNDQCLLTLTIELTSKGVKDYEKVIERCFEALAALKISGIPRYIFDEVCQIEELRYKFQSREEIFELVSNYATQMIDEPLETFPRQSLIPSCYSPDKVKELIHHLTPRACFFTLVAPSQQTKIKTTAKEKWMGVDYTLLDIHEDHLQKLERASSHMAMSIPRPNPFLPTSLRVKSQTAEKHTILPQPTLICDENFGKIYAAEDQQFLVPEVCWIFSFKTPCIADADPLSNVLADLYCHTISELLKTSSYEAQVGGLSYSLKPNHGALELKILGYSEKAGDLLKKVLETMKSANPSEAQFAQYVETLTRDYKNELNSTPLKQGGELMRSILFKEFSGLEQKQKALKNVTYSQAQRFCKNVLHECYVEGMLFGNMTLDEAKDTWEQVKWTLPFTPYPPSQHPKISLAHLPSQDPPSFLQLRSETPSNAVILTMDCGTFSFKRRAAQEILTKGLEEPFFSELRTRQQTAYLVANWSQVLERHLYSFFAIQSTSHDARDLLARFELFIESSLQHLKEKVIPEERFESIRAAYIHQLKNPAENLQKMGSLLHTVAFQYDSDFDWMEKRIKAFEELTYDEFISYGQEFLGKENARRLAICVNGVVPKKGHIAYRQVTTVEKLRSEICYEGKDALPPAQ
jgi:insulysin